MSITHRETPQEAPVLRPPRHPRRIDEDETHPKPQKEGLGKKAKIAIGSAVVGGLAVVSGALGLGLQSGGTEAENTPTPTEVPTPTTDAEIPNTTQTPEVTTVELTREYAPVPAEIMDSTVVVGSDWGPGFEQVQNPIEHQDLVDHTESQKSRFYATYQTITPEGGRTPTPFALGTVVNFYSNFTNPATGENVLVREAWPNPVVIHDGNRTTYFKQELDENGDILLDEGITVENWSQDGARSSLGGSALLRVDTYDEYANETSMTYLPPDWRQPHNPWRSGGEAYPDGAVSTEHITDPNKMIVVAAGVLLHSEQLSDPLNPNFESVLHETNRQLLEAAFTPKK